MSAGPAIVFVGVHREAVDPFRFLIEAGENVAGLVTLTERAMRRVSAAVDLTGMAEAAGIPCLRVKNVNQPESIDWIRQRAPDLLLVVGWTQLVREELLDVPRLACLGFHASLLPRYRGRAPVNWALIHGERETGNTMIVLAPGADEGDIVSQRRIPITDEDDCGTLYDKVAATEVEMLAEVLPAIRDGQMPRIEQDDREASVMPRRRPEDGVVDWAQPARKIFNWVRALTHPYPGAFTSSARGRVLIWKVEESGEPDGGSALPGAVRHDDRGWPLVACASGWVRVLRAQLDGCDELDGVGAGRDYLRAGTRLGPATEGDGT